MKSNSFSKGVVRDVKDARAFFISANGYSGFRTQQNTLYKSEEFERIYVILGGPGTGKSSLLREVALAAGAAGAECEYIYCSSDPDSLDGIIVSKGSHRLALLDGTAPHERGALVPGAIDELIHLGACWDTERLVAHREEILSKRSESAASYARARRYLSLAGETARSLEAELDQIFNRDKLRNAVAREIRALRTSALPFEKTRYICACGMSGVVRLNTFCHGNDVIYISDEYGAAHRYLDEMRRQFRTAGKYAYWLFPSSFDEEITDGIYLPHNKRLYLTESFGREGKKINTKRFIISQREAKRRAHIRALHRQKEEMIRYACASLSEAGAQHFALEEIYGGAMNFKAKERMTKELCKRVLSLLCGCARD